MQSGTSRWGYGVWGVCGADVHAAPAPAPAPVFIPTILVPVVAFTPASVVVIGRGLRLGFKTRVDARVVDGNGDRREDRGKWREVEMEMYSRRCGDGDGARL
jgi:hypothetical protein